MPINELIAQGVEPIGRDLPQIAQMIRRDQQWEGENQSRNAMLQMDQEQNDLQRERFNNLDQKTAQEGKARQALAQVRWVLQSGASKKQIEQSIPEVAGGYERLHGPGSWATASDDDVRRSAADAEAKLASSLGEGPPQQEQPKLMKGAGGVMVPEVAGAQFYNEPNSAGPTGGDRQAYMQWYLSQPPEVQDKIREGTRGYSDIEDHAQDKARGTALGDAEGDRTAKQPMLGSLGYVLGALDKQIDKTMAGGPLGASGRAGSVFDYQDAARFDNLREQLSTELRAIFRIPGEGTLSDWEQKQYGLQLPDRKYNSENNRAIMTDISSRAQARISDPISKGSSPAASQFEEGKIYEDAGGNKARYVNGQWKPL